MIFEGSAVPALALDELHTGQVVEIRGFRECVLFLGDRGYRVRRCRRGRYWRKPWSGRVAVAMNPQEVLLVMGRPSTRAFSFPVYGFEQAKGF